MPKRRNSGEDLHKPIPLEPSAQQPSDKKTVPLKRAEFIVSGRTLGELYQKIIYLRARNLGITGTIETRGDGTVRAVAEGEDGSIEKFQDALRVEMPPILVEEVRKGLEEGIEAKAKEFVAVHVKTEEEELHKENLYGMEQEKRNATIEDWMRANGGIEGAVHKILDENDVGNELRDCFIYYAHPFSKIYEDIIKEVGRTVPELHKVPWLIERRDKTKAHLNELELELLTLYPKVAMAVKGLQCKKEGFF